MGYELLWSDQSVKNLEDILDDIRSKWSEKEVNNFKRKLGHQLNLIVQNPYIFSCSND